MNYSILFMLILLANSFAVNSQDLEFVYEPKTKINLGDVIKVGIVETKANGKVSRTKGLLDGKMSWSKFKVEIEGGSFDKGIITVSNRYQDIQENQILVKVSDKSNPDILNFKYEIPIDFCGTIIVNYKPTKAKNGRRGFPRLFFTRILYRSLKGRKGKDGEDGIHGKDLKIEVTKIDEKNSQDTLFLFNILDASNKSVNKSVINPKCGVIKIIADGGDGGDGGKGGPGVGDEFGGAKGGRGGNGGNGGAGGDIEVIADCDLKKYLNCMILSNKGGNAGIGGRGGNGGVTDGIGGVWIDAGSGLNGSKGFNGKDGLPPIIKYSK